MIGDNYTSTDDDFVRYLNTKEVKKSCCSWKTGCIITSLSWLLTSASVITTIAILTAKKYIVIEFQNPNSNVYNATNITTL